MKSNLERPIGSRWLRASLLVALASIASCKDAIPTFEWKEEILLHDGRKIIAERVDVLGGWAEPGQKGAPQERRITFADPDNPQQKFTHKITGSSNYLLLDFVKGEPWLIVFVGPFSNETRCPIGSYETFRWREGVWSSVSYATLPAAIAKANMAVTYAADEPDRRKARTLLSAETIAEINTRKSRHGGISAAWHLVQTMDEGNPLDPKHPLTATITGSVPKRCRYESRHGTCHAGWNEL